MNAFRQQLTLAGLILGVLVIAAGWATLQVGHAADQAQEAAKKHAGRAQAVARIKAEYPGGGSVKELGPAIEQALREANIPLAKNQLTSPLPVREDGGIKREETEIVLTEVSLRQSLLFMQGLGKQVPGLQWSAFQMSAARGSASDLWTLRVTASRVK